MDFENSDGSIRIFNVHIQPEFSVQFLYLICVLLYESAKFFHLIDLKSLKKAGDSFGIEGNPRNDNLFLWVRMLFLWVRMLVASCAKSTFIFTGKTVGCFMC